MKNTHIRKDGRFEWQQMIDGKRYQVIDRDFDKFCKRRSQKIRELKKATNVIPTKETKATLYQLIVAYYERYIVSQVNKGTLKASSARRYVDAIKYLKHFNKTIDHYTKDDIVDYFNRTRQHRTGAYCFFLLKHVFENEFENGNINRNPIATLKNPYLASRCMQKGSWLNLEQQRLLKANLTNSIFSKEILFYLMTGCRLKESYDATIDFEKHLVYVNRHKTEHSGVKSTAIPLSTTFCDYIKNDWSKMFKVKPTHMSQKITNFFRRISIKDKSTHSLRHTFSTNLYYLGIDPKKQQYLMGHASIKQTFDTYTTLDIAITKQDILDIWGNLYPEF